MTGAPARTLVLDESLDARLAAELRHRGREAHSVATLGLAGTTDLDLLHRVDAELPSWVLVTADDGLPADLAEALAGLGGALATVEPARTPGRPLEAYRHEVVHRWAHAMHGQPAGTVRRYGLAVQGRWRPRRRHAR